MYANQDNVLQFASAATKIPPQCLEAEEAILGGIMLDPNAIMRVRDQLKRHHFYLNAHQDIYQAAIRLNALEKPTDILVVTSYLSDNKLLEIIGGRNKLANLLDRCVSAVNIDALADLVISKWKRRELGRLGTIAMELQHKSDNEVPLEQAFEELQTHLTNLQLGQNPVSSTSHISEVMIDAYQQIEERNQGLTLPGIPTGFYDLDELLSGGINRGDLVIIAGRPSMGKSAIAAQIAFNVAQLQNRTVVLFSLEMSKIQIAMRMLCAEANIESGFLKTGHLADSQWQPLAQREALGNTIAFECAYSALCPLPSPNQDHQKLPRTKSDRFEARDARHPWLTLPCLSNPFNQKSFN
ncbi:MAG: replicative DNA helicase [Hassallia sp.]